MGSYTITLFWGRVKRKLQQPPLDFFRHRLAAVAGKILLPATVSPINLIKRLAPNYFSAKIVAAAALFV